MDGRAKSNPGVSGRKAQDAMPNAALPDQQGALPVPTPVKSQIEDALESVLERHEFFAGPIPPPALLRQYDDIVPGAAERLLSMAERQLDHQINWEHVSLQSQSRNSFAGLVFGFLIGIGLIGGAVFCAVIGQERVALALVGASALGLVPAFVNAWTRVQSRTHESPSPAGRDAKKKK